MAIDVIKERQRNDFQDALQNVEEEVLNEVSEAAKVLLLLYLTLPPPPLPFSWRKAGMRRCWARSCKNQSTAGKTCRSWAASWARAT